MGPFKILKDNLHFHFDHTLPPTLTHPAHADWPRLRGAHRKKKGKEKKRKASSLLIRPAQQIKPH